MLTPNYDCTRRPGFIFAILFATVAAGWMMAVSAVVAKRLLDAGNGDASRLQNKLVTTRFFARHLLPQVHGLLPAVTAGKEDLLAFRF